MTMDIDFNGNFWEYFLVSLLLLVLSVITLGLAFPYWSYWNLKYFFTKLSIAGRDVVFTGNFLTYFLVSLGLLILSAITFGLLLPYYLYWSFKYFFDNLQVSA